MIYQINRSSGIVSLLFMQMMINLNMSEMLCMCDVSSAPALSSHHCQQVHNHEPNHTALMGVIRGLVGIVTNISSVINLFLIPCATPTLTYNQPINNSVQCIAMLA